MENLILLVGNPNAGKSTLFNRLTRGHARVGNWHGVTVDALSAPLRPPMEGNMVDLPGIYNARGKTLEEKFASRYLAEHPDAALCFVSEYANLARFVPLMAELTANGRRCALVLTKKKLFLRAKGEADEAKLSARLRIPVLSFEDKNLGEKLVAALSSGPRRVENSPLEGAFRPAEGGLSRMDALLLSGFSLPLYACMLLCAFFLTFAKGMPGDMLKSLIEAAFDALAALAERIPSPVAASLLADGILRSTGSVLCFLPQIVLLQLFLTLLEESGLLSRLAVLTDGALGKIGLSGRAVFSLLMGFGCTAAAVFSTRGLDDRAMQKRVILCLPYLPCSAKLPVFLALSASFFSRPVLAVLLLYVLGALFAVVLSLFLGGKSPEFAMELAPLQRPNGVFVLKSLLFSAKQFIIKVGTVILAFLVASWLLSSFDASFTLCAPQDSMLAAICGKLDWVFAPIGMRDWRITYAALSGLVAKENVAGAISMLMGEFPYSGASAFAFCIFLLTCSPCVSAISASARELGRGRAMLYALLETLSALLLCYLAYAVAVYAAIALPLLAAASAGLLYGTIRRKRKHHAQDVHRRRLSAGVDVSSHPSEGARRARQRGESRLGYAPARRRRGGVLHDGGAGEQALAHRPLFGRKSPRRR